jgi:hypothetical protein
MVVNMTVVTSVTKDASFPSVMFIVARFPPTGVLLRPKSSGM